MFFTKSFAEDVVVYALEAMPYCGIVDGKPAGIAIDILTKATEYGAPNFSFTFDIPWIRAQKEIQAANDELICIIPFSRTSVRENKYQWIAELFPTQSRFYSYKRSRPVMSIEEAKNLTIGVVRGHAIIARLEQMGVKNLDTNADDAKMNAAKLFRERFDAIADSDLIAIYNWKMIGEKIETLQEGAPIGGITEVFITGNKNFPKKTADDISSAINEMKKNGTYQQILDYWKN